MQLALWIAGCIALAGAWGGPLPRMAGSSFSAHMTLHMAIVAVASPLLALGMSDTRFDPVKTRWAWLFAPVPASVIELIIVWAWHAPALHHAARHSSLGFFVEQSSFLIAGLWVWLSAFGGAARQAIRRPNPMRSEDTADGVDAQGLGHVQRAADERSMIVQRRGAGVLGLLLTSMHMTFLGALLALSPRLLFQHHSGLGGLSPLADQHLGGAIMLVVGGIAYLAGGLWLTADVIRLKQTLKAADAL